MILNTGSRTDIPAYYSEWFYNRIKEGFVLVRNPYNPTQVIRYRLDPETVDCLVFCTKNPRSMLARLSELKSFRQFWHVTITPYGKEIEPYVPPKENVIEAFRELSDIVGADRIGWRYDPIFIHGMYTVQYHIEVFEKIAEALAGCTKQCVISFIDLYQKVKRNFPAVRAVTREERMYLGREMIRIGEKYGMTIYPCCEGDELAKYGADCSGCLSQSVLERAIGCSLSVPKKKAAREACTCLLGNDIGAYHSCGHGCLYCYANYDRKTVEENMRQRNPASPFLIGEAQADDVIVDAKQESWLDGQLRLLL